MSEILTPTFLFPAITTIIAAIWGAYIYFEARPARVREAERAALADEKAAWRELADFHKLSVEVLLKAAVLRTHPDELAVEEFNEFHRQWRALHAEKKGLLGPKGRERALSISKSLTIIGVHHMRLIFPLPTRGVLQPSVELTGLAGRISRDVTYFIH